MSNEEQTQIFRGDDAPPEMAIAETGGPALRRRPAAPSDQRSLHDQAHGPSNARPLHDSRDELADLRQLHDAQGDAHLRKMDDAAGPTDARSVNDANGPSELPQQHGADGPSDQHSLRDADGPVDARHAHDADGPSELRSLQDAEGLVDTRHVQDAEGPSIQRQMQDASQAPGAAPPRASHNFHDDEPPAAETDRVTLNSFGEPVAPDPADAAPEAQAQATQSDPDLTFKVEEDATPWALSIHLEARIASLTESTAKVNEQLGSLEDSIKRLAKRIGK